MGTQQVPLYHSNRACMVPCKSRRLSPTAGVQQVMSGWAKAGTQRARALHAYLPPNSPSMTHARTLVHPKQLDVATGMPL